MELQINDVMAKLIDFRTKRDWKQFHTPKNLAISISIEAAELLEHFQWIKENEDLSPTKIAEVEEEIADIFIYLLLIADAFDINVLHAAMKKISENEKKYPVEKARGTAKKYKEL